MIKNIRKKLSDLIKESDAVFSEFIRLRDSDASGYVKCFICGARLWWRHSQSMHFIDRDNMATRYNEFNCHSGCETCNCFDPEHKERFEAKLLEKYPDPVLNVVEHLKLRAKSLTKFMPFELEDIIEKYSLSVKELKKQKGLK